MSEAGRPAGPGSVGGRLGGWLVAALGVAAATAGVLRAVELTWFPQGIPSFDVADYVNQALRYRDALGLGRFDEVGALFLEPNKHPPLHALALGGWLSAVGGGMVEACSFELGLFALALCGLVWVGHRVDPRSGRWAGLGAAVLTAWTAEHQRLAAAPMTENLALLAALVAIGAALPVVTRARPTTVGFVLAGVAVCAAGLVRYNLAPMLLVPFALAAVVEARTLADLRDARVLLLAAPTVLALAVWTRLRPALPQELRGFFTNVDSGIPLGSVENLTWVPRTLAGSYVGAPVAAALGALFVGGLAFAWWRRFRPAADDVPLRALRALQLVVAVSAVAITVHPYKLDRVLHGTVPLFYLCALLPLARALSARPGPAGIGLAAGSVAAMGLAVATLHVRTDADALGRLELVDRPEDRVALDFVVEETDGARYVVLSGNHPLVNRQSLEFWHRLAGRDATIEQDAPAHPDCAQDAPPPGVDCAPTVTRRYMADPALRADTAFVLVERTAGGGPKLRRAPEEQQRRVEWVKANAAAVEGLAVQYGLAETGDLALSRGGGRVRVYRGGDGVPGP